MFVVHARKKLRDRVREEPDAAATRSTTALGAWYATVLLWKPRLALLVNEATLLPAFVPLAPAATAIDRFPEHLGAARQAHSIDPAFVTAELTATAQHSYAKTANRSVVGIMNELTHLASHARPQARPAALIDLSCWLAQTPCSPLFGRHMSPDCELRAFVAGHGVAEERCGNHIGSGGDGT